MAYRILLALVLACVALPASAQESLLDVVLKRDKIIVGTPGRVADRLHELREELGLDGILAEMNCASLIPHYRVMKSLQLLCEKVMPRFH